MTMKEDKDEEEETVEDKKNITGKKKNKRTI